MFKKGVDTLVILLHVEHKDAVEKPGGNGMEGK